MAENTTLARPYSKAVFELAVAQAAIQQWSLDLDLLAVVAKDVQMARALAYPGLTNEQKADLVVDVCGKHLSKEGDNLVRVLAQHGRLPLLPEISVLFEQHKALLDLTVDVTVESAFEIEDLQKKKLQESLQKKLNRKVVLQTTINKSLIGGVVIRAGDTVIDASIKGRLTKLAEAVNS
jgi:F-type H+-transporting ATPase subunit delta